MLASLIALVRKELTQIFRDRTTVAQIFMIPVVQLLVLAHAATFDVPRAAIAVNDADRSTFSSALISRLQATGDFEVTMVTADRDRIESALRGRELRGVLTIPAGATRDAASGRPIQVQLQVNAEDGAAAAVLQARAASIVADIARDMAGGAQMGGLTIEARNWFNPSRNYKHYMVPALLVSLVTVIGLLLTAQSVAREKELGTLDQLSVTPSSGAVLMAGKLMPFWLFAMVTFSLGLLIARLAFGIPMVGNVAIVFLAAACYLLLVLGIGLWISTVVATQQQAMFVAFFVMMIFLLMSGLFTPIEAMPEWAREVTLANPVRHFVAIMRAVLVRGAGIDAVGSTIAGLAGGGVLVLTLAIRRARG